MLLFTYWGSHWAVLLPCLYISCRHMNLFSKLSLRTLLDLLDLRHRRLSYSLDRIKHVLLLTLSVCTTETRRWSRLFTCWLEFVWVFFFPTPRMFTVPPPPSVPCLDWPSGLTSQRSRRLLLTCWTPPSENPRTASFYLKRRTPNKHVHRLE